MLANGLELPEAVREAQDYTWQTLKKAYRPGMGQFLPDRLFWAREDPDAADDEPPAPPARRRRASQPLTAAARAYRRLAQSRQHSRFADPTDPDSSRP